MTTFYQPANAAEIKNQILRDLRLAAIDAGATDPPVEPGTDWDLLASAVANVSILGFANMSAAYEAENVLTATGADLDEIRKGRGLPEVAATAANGKIWITVTGAATVPAGRELVYPNGARCTVDTEAVYAAEDAGEHEISVTATEAGSKTNLAAGQIVRFKSAPTNVDEAAEVSSGEPLTGGTDAETDARKRDRILNDLRNRPNGGNWGQIRQWALDALGSVQDCYVYPGLGGPGSCKIVPVKDFDLASNDYTRTLSSTAIDFVRAELHKKLGLPNEHVFQAAAGEACSATVCLTLPDSYLAGGNWRGWLDLTPWPLLETADSYVVAVTSCASPYTTMVVTAQTATAPTSGQSHIAWWSRHDMKFYSALVVSSSGSAGAWTLTLDKPLVDSLGYGPAAGDYISPACFNASSYGAKWIEMFRALGPGENTTSVYRLPRSKRRPFVTDEDPCALTATVLASLATSFPEITDYSWGARTISTPTVPAAVSTAPNILIPYHFGIYKLV